MALIDFFFSINAAIKGGTAPPEDITLGSEDLHWGDETILMGNE